MANATLSVKPSAELGLTKSEELAGSCVSNLQIIGIVFI